MPQDIFNTGLTKLNTAFKVIDELMVDLQRRASNQGTISKDDEDLLKHFQKNGENSIYYWSCPPFMLADFDKRLSEANIAHACLTPPLSATGGKEEFWFIAKDVDKERFDAVRDAILKEARTIVDLEELKRQNVGEAIRAVRGTGLTFAGVFEEEANRANLTFSKVDNKDGTFDLYYSAKDANKAKPVLMKTLESAGSVKGRPESVTGRLNEIRIEEKENVSKEILSGVSAPKKEFYVVSPDQPNQYMHFTPEGYKYHLNERLIEDSFRNNNNFQKDAHNRIIASFSRPVVLSRDEFERVRELPQNKYKEEIVKKHIKTRTLSEREAQLLKLEAMARLLAEYKLSYDNNFFSNPYNPLESAAGFDSQERITDDRLDRTSDFNLAKDFINKESLPPDVREILEVVEKLPPESEDRKYIEKCYKDYDIRIIEEETIEITEADIDLGFGALGELGNDFAIRETFYETEERTI